MQHIPESDERLADYCGPLGGRPVTKVQRRLEPRPGAEGVGPVWDWEVIAVCKYGNAWSNPIPQGEEVEVAGLHHPECFIEPVSVEARISAVVEIEKNAELVAGNVVASGGE